MAQDFSRPVRRAVVAEMKASPAITDLIPAGSIYGQSVAADRTFPFTRYGPSITTPFLASGLESSQMRIKIGAFTKALRDGDKITDFAEDQADKMAAAIATALDGRVLILESGHKATLTWLDTICTRDGAEKDAWQASLSFRVEVAG